MITEFRGPHRFLSNFHPSPIRTWSYLLRREAVFHTVEHGYQACKTLDATWHRLILEAPTPAIAKKLGRQCPVREDWEGLKLPLMRHLIDLKFDDPTLADALLSTGEVQLVEGNTWGDTFWGVCRGVGDNWLGRILMEKRAALRRKT